jgi:hypothetical protein
MQLVQSFSRWQEHNVAGPYTVLSFQAMLPCCYRVRTKLVWHLHYYNVNNILAKSKTTDAAIMVKEASQQPNNGE